MKQQISSYRVEMAPATEAGCDPCDELAGSELGLSGGLGVNHYDRKRKINLLHSPIVRHLPPDVISTIFEFCIPDFTDNQHINQLSPYFKEDLSIPLSLGAICSYWRDIAWLTPSLWSSLVVRVTNKHDPRILTILTQEWLSRSGQLPLAIRISSNLHEAVLALANIINQYSARWSDLDLFIPDSYYQHFRATDNHAPLLKSIRLNCSTYVETSIIHLICPRLERAFLSYFPMGGTNIQWDNLTHLTLHSMFITDSLVILRKTPRLVFCNVSGFTPRYRGPSIGMFVLPSLKSLQLTSFVEDFFNNLIAPDLEELSLREYYIPSIEAIVSFLRRSACSLRYFSTILSSSPSYVEGFMDLLQSMHSLNKLSITSITNTDLGKNTCFTVSEDYDPRKILGLVAKVLSSQSTSLQQGFLPNLEILEYSGKLNPRPDGYGDLHSLLPAVNAMHHGPLHLFQINLTQHRLPKNMISYLSSLKERGVAVNVMFKSKDILQSSINYFRSRDDFFGLDWANNLDSSLFS